MLSELHAKIGQNGYKCTMDAEELIHSALMMVNPGKQKVPGLLLLGEAGVGKTFFAECFAKAIGAKLLFYQCHRATGKPELLYDLDVKGVVERLAGYESEQYLSKGILPLAIEMTKHHTVVLVIDEIEKTPYDLDAFWLDFMQSGRVFDPNLGHFEVFCGEPEEGETEGQETRLFVIATSNQDRLLSEPLMRRFRRVYMEYPPREVEIEIICRAEPEASRRFVSDLVDAVREFRKIEGLMKKPSTPELCNAVGDIVALVDPKHRAKALLSWVCAYEEDREPFLRRWSLTQWENGLVDEAIFENGEVE